MRPAPVQPVGLVGLVFLAGLELLVQMGLEGGLHVLDLALGDQPVLDQPLGVELQRGLLGLDLLVHDRVGEHGLVALVVTEPAIAEHVDHHVLAELLAELGRDLGGVHHGLRVIAVHVEDRRLDHQRDVRRIGRGAREMRRGGEADLVVHDEMDRAAGAVPAQPDRPKPSATTPWPAKAASPCSSTGHLDLLAARCRPSGPAWRGPCPARRGSPPRGARGWPSATGGPCCRRTRGPTRRRGGTSRRPSHPRPRA
jgi:hypothetical protein